MQHRLTVLYNRYVRMPASKRTVTGRRVFRDLCCTRTLQDPAQLLHVVVRNLNVLSRPLDYLYENIFGCNDNIVARTGVFRESIEFDDGSIDEACK